MIIDKSVYPILSTVNKKVASDPSLEEEDDYNCFGLVESLLNWRDELSRVSQKEIEDNLESKTVLVSVPRFGDIAVYKEEERVVHTAFVLGRDQLIQKAGSLDLELQNFAGNKPGAIDYGTITEFRRVV